MRTRWFATRSTIAAAHAVVLLLALVGTPSQALAEPPNLMPPVVKVAQPEAARLYSRGRVIRRTGIQLTIPAVAGLGLGIGLLVKGMSLRPADEQRGMVLEYVGGSLMAGGILMGGIGVPLWIVGQSRMNRAREVGVAQPFVARAHGGLLAGISMVF